MKTKQLITNPFSSHLIEEKFKYIEIPADIEFFRSSILHPTIWAFVYPYSEEAWELFENIKKNDIVFINKTKLNDNWIFGYLQFNMAIEPEDIKFVSELKLFSNSDICFRFDHACTKTKNKWNNFLIHRAFEANRDEFQEIKVFESLHENSKRYIVQDREEFEDIRIMKFIPGRFIIIHNYYGDGKLPNIGRKEISEYDFLEYANNEIEHINMHLISRAEFDERMQESYNILTKTKINI